MHTNPVDKTTVTEGLFVWVDIETTGLNCNEDYILELGVKVTNKKFEVLRERSWIVVPPDGWVKRLKLTPEAEKIHTESGLIDEVINTEISDKKRKFIEDHPLYEGTEALVSYLAWKWLVDGLELEAGIYPMCGSNVANFDRQFALRRLPVFNSFFHYRNIDVSTIKELCKALRPDLYAEILHPDKKPHRVLLDIDWSIAELKFYLENFFNINQVKLESRPITAYILNVPEIEI